MSLAAYIDHTFLRPDATPADIDRLCDEAVANDFAAVCVPPYYVRRVARRLENSAVRTATVIGYPTGYSHVSAKVAEIQRAVQDGADELDVVVNIAAIKSAAWNDVERDLHSCTMAVHLHGKVIKLIVEASLLTDKELVRICELAATAGVNYVKTSTGYEGGAEIETVRTLRAHLPATVKIKASGGIRTPEAARALVAAGADRLGCSSSLALLQVDAPGQAQGA